VRRLPFADARLTAFARAWIGRPFEWGRCDCVLLAANAVDALAGTRFGQLYTGLWSDEKSARRYQREAGDASLGLRIAGLEEPFAPDLIFEERIGGLRRGDLILARFGGFFCAHVAFGALCLSTDPKRPVGWLATAEVLAWPRAIVLRVP